VSVLDGRYEEQLALAGDELDRLVRRLRNLSPGAWRLRREPVVAALGRLAELTALAERRTVPKPPTVAEHALADAMAVIGGDVIVALTTSRDGNLMAILVVELRQVLDATR
jgi:hypothetical protein